MNKSQGENKMAVACLLLLVLCVGAVRATGDARLQCDYEMCTCTRDVIDCSGRGLTQLPAIELSDPPPSQKSMDISNNNISVLADTGLPRGLQELISKGNPISSISSDAFETCSNSLTSLVITSSYLLTIPPAIFDLTNLTSLTWSNNLDLSHLPDLSILDTLIKLDLSNNQLMDTSLVNLPASLEVLDLSLNSLTVIPATVSELSHLTSLDLHHNKISSVDNFSFPLQLQRLDLSNNNIVDLSSIKFGGLHLALSSLDLSNNPLKNVENEAFRDTPNLTIVDLSGTSLRQLPRALTILTRVRVLRCGNMSQLLCDCTQVPIVQWYYSLGAVDVQGQCGDSSDLRTTLDYLSQFCPNYILG